MKAENLFLLLFLLSPAAWIIGLIKPGAYSSLLKRSLTRKKINLLFLTTALLFFFLFGLTHEASKTAVKPKEQTEATKTGVDTGSEHASVDQNNAINGLEGIKDEKEREYLKEFVRGNKFVGHHLEKLGSFVAENSNPLMWTEDERVSFDFWVGNIETSWYSARDLSPTEEYKEPHETYLDGLEKIVRGTLSMQEEVDKFFQEGAAVAGADKIDEAAALLKEGEGLVKDAAKQLAEVLDKKRRDSPKVEF